jgi:hypothetical protein
MFILLPTTDGTAGHVHYAVFNESEFTNVALMSYL